MYAGPRALQARRSSRLALRLIPRVIPAVGLIGAPLLFAANVATLFGYNEQTSTVTMLATLPIAFWDERLSTVAAERALLEADASRRKRAEVIDQVAAGYILQGALDRLRHLA